MRADLISILNTQTRVGESLDSAPGPCHMGRKLL